MGAQKINYNNTNRVLMRVSKSETKFIIDFNESDKILEEFKILYLNELKNLEFRDKKRIKDIDVDILKSLVRLLGGQLNTFNKTYQSIDHIDFFKLKKSYNYLNKHIAEEKAREILKANNIDTGSYSRKEMQSIINKYSERTVGRHIHHLEALGLLKIDNYRNQNRYILNPFLLSFTKGNEKIAKFLKAEYQIIKDSNRTSCPAYKSSKRIINLLTSNVEMLITPKIDEDSLLLIPKEQKAIVGNDLTDEYTHQGGTESEKYKISEGEQKRKDYIKQFALNMWLWMFTNLYEGKIKFIAPSEKQFALDFFENEAMKQNNWKQLEKFAKETSTKLYKWKKHLDKFDGFTPVPSYFLNPNNKNVYSSTDIWIKTNKKQRIWLKENTNIDKVLLDIKHVLNGKENNKKRLPNGCLKIIKRSLNYKEIIEFINLNTDSVERFCTKNGRNDLLMIYRSKLAEIIQNADWAKINQWNPSNDFEKQVTSLENQKLKVNYRKHSPVKKEVSEDIPKEERVTEEQLNKLNNILNIFNKR